jgi:alginate O-acetyltransferase complex protein AlgI
MLFNSDIFLFEFLPIVWIGCFILRFISVWCACLWLVLASCVFYANWNAVSLVLLLSSIALNFSFGRIIDQTGRLGWPKRSTCFLALAITLDLVILGYFKYAAFLINNLGYLVGATWNTGPVPLPLGISFFTFTQIAFLVDVRRDLTRERGSIYYFLFVSFFPHLIAGPILHHKEMIPQFRALPLLAFKNGRHLLRRTLSDVNVGLSIFAFGLFKKVMLADSVQHYVTPVFAPASMNQAALAAAGVSSASAMSSADAWIAVLAYTLQIYFDFSGYSDMAIGIARTFGIVFPQNFSSPYKAVNIIEFWRRWHMTLSRFLRDYLYIPLGGNRSGLGRTPNLLITMLLGGLWHGAGWTFIFWGALHGIYLIANHAWRSIQKPEFFSRGPFRVYGKTAACLLTFLSVAIAWVFFRADTFSNATLILRQMAGIHAMEPAKIFVCTTGLNNCLFGFHVSVWVIAALLVIVFLAPNTQEVMARWRPTLEPTPEMSGMIGRYATWMPTILWALIVGMAVGLCIQKFGQTSQFLYYQF